jgi:hypothetical protein
MIDRSTGIVVTLCIVGFLGSSLASGQSLADAAAKEKERRRKSAESSAPAAAGAKPASSTPAAPTEVHTDSWWRSHSRTGREAVADAEAQVKYYQARLDEARTDRQPGPTDDAPHTAPSRVLTDAERRDAEVSLAAAQKQLAAARKQMQELEERARREQVPPEWLR